MQLLLIVYQLWLDKAVFGTNFGVMTMTRDDLAAIGEVLEVKVFLWKCHGNHKQA